MSNQKLIQDDFFYAIPDIDKEPRFQTQIVAKKNIARESIFILSLKRPENFSFVYGQYIWLVLPARSKVHGVVDRRAYSIASNPDGDTLDLIIRNSGSEYIKAVGQLKIGETIEIIGPMGSAFLVPKQGCIMIAGGVGVSPFLSIFRSKLPGKVSIAAYNEKERASYIEKELKKAAEGERGKECYSHIGSPQKEDFTSWVQESDTRPIFISGPQGFVDAVTDILLSLGIGSKRMHYEENHPTKEGHALVTKIFSDFLKEKQGLHDLENFPSIETLFSAVVMQTTNHVVVTDSNGTIMYANKAAERITGYTLKEMRGQTARLWGGLMPKECYRILWKKKLQKQSIICTVVNRNKHGRLYFARVHITPLLKNGKVLAYIATEEDITKLMNLDKAKNEFISLASHQLRMPPSTVAWYAEMLLTGDAGKLSKKQKEFIEEIYNSNKRMIDLVNALLDISRIELGTVSTKNEPTDIARIIDSVLRELGTVIKEKHLKIRKKYKKSKAPTIHADKNVIRIIVENLISNAVKYTQESGTIEIDLQEKGGGLIFYIQDNGYGIPKNQQDEIFTKLFRADNIQKIDTTGTGLGLYMIKKILNKLGGKIWFESEENKGSTFYVAFPVSGMKEEEGIKPLV